MATNLVTDTLLMIRPVAFGMNEQTAVNNFYQQRSDWSDTAIQEEALSEFDKFVEVLRSEGVQVIVVDDTPEPATPDSIFPNNWVSFHDTGDVWLYPMYAKNRRQERRNDIIKKLQDSMEVRHVHSLASWEDKSKFLEGTGSMIFDRPNNVVYAALSERTDSEVLDDFSQRSGMQVIRFHAYQSVNKERKLIYHTNVMMFVGEAVAVICAAAIDDDAERKLVLDKLKETGKEIIEISEEQTEQFAGNMLQVKSTEGERKIVMSKAAFTSLDERQKARLSEHGKLLYSDLSTIEKLGGGSARCMMAEVFLPNKNK